MQLGYVPHPKQEILEVSVSHDMFTSIRSLLETKDVVPATVAGVSHVNKDDVNMAMCKMIELLHLA